MLCTHTQRELVDLARPSRDKKARLLNLEEELMVEACCLLKKEKEVLSPFLSFRLILEQ